MPSELLPRRQQPSQLPKLSVVVPVYNVAAYLGECLDSILDQDFPRLEVVMVDDGSTDGSAAVAAEYARRYTNVVVITCVNSGPGAARNLGIAHAKGEFLAFVDSDDLLLPRAFDLLLSTLEESSSDFVVGSVQRPVDGALVEAPFMRALHRQRRLGLAIDDKPEMITDCFVWNKLFRRSFWDRAGLRFPTGVRYEDQVTITEAYLRADAFDVVRRPVYLWRVRADGSSITQRRFELGDLEDRLRTKRMTTELVAELGTPHVLDYWLSHGLGGDLPLYFRYIPGCSDEYWERLVTGVRALFAGHPPIHESRRLRVHSRLVGWLITENRRSAAETICRWVAEHPGPLPLQTEGDHVVALLPFHDNPDPGIPKQLFWLAEHELRFDARLLGVRVDATCLEVTGIALIRGAPPTGVVHTIDAALRSDTGEQVPMDVEPLSSTAGTSWVDRLPQRYDDCEFVARVDAAGLIEAGSSRSGARWRMELRVRVGDITRAGGFHSKAPDAELPVSVDGRPGLLASFEPDRGLVVTVSSQRCSPEPVVRQPTRSLPARSEPLEVD